MSKCLVLFVEGDTEMVFYKKVIDNAKTLRSNGKFDTDIKYKCLDGIGGFKNNALRKFVKEIKPKHDKDCEFIIALCRDTDVFEMSPKPPINWSEVERELRDNGAANVIHIKAKRSIEDWFLYDTDGIIKFLQLKKGTKAKGSNGFEKLKDLYQKANKVYYKGRKCSELIEHLDIDKIVDAVKDQLNPLYKALGVEKAKHKPN